MSHPWAINHSVRVNLFSLQPRFDCSSLMEIPVDAYCTGAGRKRTLEVDLMCQFECVLIQLGFLIDQASCRWMTKSMTSSAQSHDRFLSSHQCDSYRAHPLPPSFPHTHTNSQRTYKHKPTVYVYTHTHTVTTFIMSDGFVKMT